MGMAAAIESVLDEIKKIQKISELSGNPVCLLGATKGQPPARIIEAIELGMTDFGENRVQEAVAKWEDIKKRFPKVRLHLIGPLQTNKVRQALALFDVIQTIDRPKLAEAIAAELNPSNPRILKFANPSFYIQVNIGKEPQKAGVMPQEADRFIEYCTKELKLNIVGLMCVPPQGKPPAAFFAMLRDMARRHGLKELSMGMSDDFKEAVRMGSTCIRLGRALFGERSG